MFTSRVFFIRSTLPCMVLAIQEFNNHLQDYYFMNNGNDLVIFYGVSTIGQGQHLYIMSNLILKIL